jgi:hypothetical protein
MGNRALEKANFDEVASRNKTTILINVLSEAEQGVLIRGTVPCSDEVAEVENAIAQRDTILVYGMNCHDERIFAKYQQIKKLGGKPKVYVGGLFEWMLLNEIYGNERFPLSTDQFDLYQYRPK